MINSKIGFNRNSDLQKHTDVETQEAREPFLNQNQHAVNELDEEGMKTLNSSLNDKLCGFY